MVKTFLKNLYLPFWLAAILFIVFLSSTTIVFHFVSELPSWYDPFWILTASLLLFILQPLWLVIKLHQQLNDLVGKIGVIVVYLMFGILVLSRLLVRCGGYSVDAVACAPNQQNIKDLIPFITVLALLVGESLIWFGFHDNRKKEVVAWFAVAVMVIMFFA